MNTITSANYEIPARQVLPGMRYRSLGRGCIARTVQSVEALCNCETSSRNIDPETREPLHFERVVIKSDSLTSNLMPDTTCTIATDDSL
jgi:hypothetical protein